MLALHVQPGAAQTEAAGRHGDAIKVRVAARAVEGKANAELRRYLAGQFGVPVANVTLLRGGVFTRQGRACRSAGAASGSALAHRP